MYSLSLGHISVEPALFKDIRFFVSGIADEKFTDLLIKGGASRTSYLSSFVTHCFVGEDPDESELSESIDLHEIPVLRFEWAFYSAKFSQLLPVTIFSAVVGQIFDSLQVCVDPNDLSTIDLYRLWALIFFRGGTVLFEFGINTTHLVTCAVSDRTCYIEASKRSTDVHIVTPDYFEECISASSLLDPIRFHPRLLLLKGQMYTPPRSKTKTPVSRVYATKSVPPPPTSSVSCSPTVIAVAVKSRPPPVDSTFIATNDVNLVNENRNIVIQKSNVPVQRSNQCIPAVLSNSESNAVSKTQLVVSSSTCQLLSAASIDNSISYVTTTASTAAAQTIQLPQTPVEVTPQMLLAEQKPLVSVQGSIPTAMLSPSLNARNVSVNHVYGVNQVNQQHPLHVQLQTQQPTNRGLQRPSLMLVQQDQHQKLIMQQQQPVPELTISNSVNIVTVASTTAASSTQLINKHSQLTQCQTMQQGHQVMIPQIRGSGSMSTETLMQQQQQQHQQQQQQQWVSQQQSQWVQQRNTGTVSANGFNRPQMQPQIMQQQQQWVSGGGVQQQQMVVTGTSNSTMLRARQPADIVQKQHQVIQQHMASLNVEQRNAYTQMVPREKHQYLAQHGLLLRLTVNDQQREMLSNMDAQQRTLFFQKLHREREVQQQQMLQRQQQQQVNLVSPQQWQQQQHQFVQGGNGRMQQPHMVRIQGSAVHLSPQAVSQVPLVRPTVVTQSWSNCDNASSPTQQRLQIPSDVGVMIPSPLRQVSPPVMPGQQHVNFIPGSPTAMNGTAQKTKAALANMLNSRMAQPGSIPSPRHMAPDGSASNRLQMMNLQQHNQVTHNNMINASHISPQTNQLLLHGIHQQNSLSPGMRDPASPGITSGVGMAVKSSPNFSGGVVGGHRMMQVQPSQQAPLRQPQPNTTPPRLQFFGHEHNARLPSNMCLLGCVVSIVDYNDPSCEESKYVDEWCRLMKFFGCEIEADYHQNTTHLLCKQQSSLSSSPAAQALRDGKRLITANWLKDVIKQKRLSPPWMPLHFPLPASYNYPCKHMILSLTGFVDDERSKVKEMIRLTGAKFTSYLTKHNHAIICRHSSGEKYSKAKDWSIPVVNIQWLTDALFANNVNPIQSLNYPKYQQFKAEDPFHIDYTLVPHLMSAWKSPIRVTTDAYQRFMNKKENVENHKRGRKRKKLPYDLVDVEGKINEAGSRHIEYDDGTNLGLTNGRCSSSLSSQYSDEADVATPTVVNEVVQNVKLNVLLNGGCSRFLDERTVSGSKSVKQIKILFSGLSVSQVKSLTLKVKALGGELASSPVEATHLVMISLKRTNTFVSAIPFVSYIVSPLWITESHKENAGFKDESKYILHDEKFEKLFKCSISYTLSQPKRDKLFQGKTFYITPSVSPDWRFLREVIVSVGGQVDNVSLWNVRTIQDANRFEERHSIHWEPVYIIIACDDDIHLVAHILKAKIGIFSTEFVLSAILRNEMDFDLTQCITTE